MEFKGNLKGNVQALPIIPLDSHRRLCYCDCADNIHVQLYSDELKTHPAYTCRLVFDKITSYFVYTQKFTSFPLIHADSISVMINPSQYGV